MKGEKIKLEISYLCNYPDKCKWDRKCNECEYAQAFKVKEKIKPKRDVFKLNFFS